MGTMLNRRSLVAAALSLPGVAAATPMEAGRPAAKIDLRDPHAALQAYVRLRGSSAEQTVFQPYEGDISSVADGNLSIPLCGFWGLQKSVWRHDGHGGFITTDYDLGFYVDTRSREILKTWANPLTGKTVEVFHYRGGPSGGHFTAGQPGDDVYGSAIGRWSVLGDQIWHTSASASERPNPMTPAQWPLASSGTMARSAMSISFAGRLSDIADPALHCPPTLQIWTDVAGWMPWMEMGQRPGSNAWRWLGAKGTAVAALPSALVQAAEAVWPGYVSRDSAWREPTSGRLDYMRAKQGLKPSR